MYVCIDSVAQLLSAISKVAFQYVFRFFRRTLSVLVLIGVGRIRSERAGGLRDADDADRHGHRGSVVARRGVGRVQTPILPCYRKRSHRGTRSYHASFWMYVCMYRWMYA